MANHPQRPQPGRGPGGGQPRGEGGSTDAVLKTLLAPPPEKDRFRYFKDKETPRPEIFDKDAREAGEKLAEIPPSQLRRFYAEVMTLKRQLELTSAPPLTDEAIRARLHLLKARAAYTLARHKNDTAYQELARFFTLHAESVQGRDDFLHGFQPYFEAVIAYHAAASASESGGKGA